MGVASTFFAGHECHNRVKRIISESFILNAGTKTTYSKQLQLSDDCCLQLRIQIGAQYFCVEDTAATLSILTFGLF